MPELFSCCAYKEILHRTEISVREPYNFFFKLHVFNVSDAILFIFFLKKFSNKNMALFYSGFFIMKQCP